MNERVEYKQFLQNVFTKFEVNSKIVNTISLRTNANVN